jgi:hypothetical protein
MNLLTTVVAQASNTEVPYHSLVSGDHTVFLPEQRILAVAHLANYRLPWYPNDVFVAGANPDPPLDSGAHAYVSQYARNHSIIGINTLDTGMSLTDATNMEVDNCTSVTFTGMVGQGWMSMVGMVFADPAAGGTFQQAGVAHLATRVVYDAETGRVRHLSQATVLPGASAPPGADFDDAVLAVARHRVPDADLRLLVSDQRPRPDHALRVDLDNGHLVASPPRAR